ncbi:hypothetical protein [Streptacidiphilus carbonis]|uniref:hypothetical protein n=1 Tax=Streptacidiphilus carbonis TaxID=105422 RepID=UPI0005A93A04|nr:hypothetical protein [Streptacidiphilus carbonis]
MPAAVYPSRAERVLGRSAAALVYCDARIACWSARSQRALRRAHTLACALAMTALASVLLAQDPERGVLVAALVLAAAGSWTTGRRQAVRDGLESSVHQARDR